MSLVWHKNGNVIWPKVNLSKVIWPNVISLTQWWKSHLAKSKFVQSYLAQCHWSDTVMVMSFGQKSICPKLFGPMSLVWHSDGNVSWLKCHLAKSQFVECHLAECHLTQEWLWQLIKMSFCRTNHVSVSWEDESLARPNDVQPIDVLLNDVVPFRLFHRFNKLEWFSKSFEKKTATSSHYLWHLRLIW